MIEGKHRSTLLVLLFIAMSRSLFATRRSFYSGYVPLIALILTTPLVAQLVSAGPRPDLRWQGIGMEEFWRGQAAADGGRSAIQHVVPHVSSSDLRTVFEVVVGDTRKAFVPEMIDRWGTRLGEAGAERQADIERRVLLAQGLDAKVEKSQVRQATLYIQARAGLLQAIDAETGEIRWTILSNSGQQPVTLPAVNDHAVATVAGTTLNVFSASDGSFLWSRRLRGIPSSYVAIARDMIFVGRLRAGIELYSLDGTGVTQFLPSSGFQAANFALSPQEKLAWPTSVGYTYVADSELVRNDFRIETRSPAFYPASFASDGTLCIATSDGLVTTANSDNGEIRWHFMAGGSVRQSPMTFQDVVGIVTSRNELICLDLATGQPRWRRGGIRAWAGVVGNRLLAVDQRDELVAFDLEHGQQLGASPLNGMQLLLSQVLSDRVYLTNGRGSIVALRPTDGLWPTIYAPLFSKDAEDEHQPPAASNAPTPTAEKPTESPSESAPAPEDAPEEPADDPFGDDPFGADPAPNPFGDG